MEALAPSQHETTHAPCDATRFINPPGEWKAHSALLGLAHAAGEHPLEHVSARHQHGPVDQHGGGGALLTAHQLHLRAVPVAEQLLQISQQLPAARNTTTVTSRPPKCVATRVTSNT